MLQLSLRLDGMIRALFKSELEELCRRLAARLAGNYDEFCLGDDRLKQLIQEQEVLRKLIRAVKKVLEAILANIRALLLRILQSSARQDPNECFSDGMVASVPVPPTQMLSVTFYEHLFSI